MARFYPNNTATAGAVATLLLILGATNLKTVFLSSGQSAPFMVGTSLLGGAMLMSGMLIGLKRKEGWYCALGSALIGVVWIAALAVRFPSFISVLDFQFSALQWVMLLSLTITQVIKSETKPNKSPEPTPLKRHGSS